MTLLQLLKSRYKIAEKYTKDNYIDDVERSIQDYEAKEMDLKQIVESSGNAINKRYEFVIPLIFTNVEGMKASMFDRIPDIVVKGRGAKDEIKKQKVEAAYEYLKDKLDLESFAIEAAHWFILNGFTTAHIGFKSDTFDYPATDNNGQPMLNEDGTPVMGTGYYYNDPTIECGNPCKEYFSPESEYSIDAVNIPYFFRKKLMTKSEVKKIYNYTIEEDAELDLDKNLGEDEKKDLKRVCIYFYNGQVPAENKEDIKKWVEYNEDKNYKVIYCKKRILFAQEIDQDNCKIGKWYGNPNKFFGFGLGKIGRQFQKERSIRRGQQIRLADVAAFPKYAVKNDGQNAIDTKTLLDPREQLVLLYESEAPTILQPGNLAEVVTASDLNAEKDAQQAFGMLDLGSGSQKSTVDTATGQSIFADAMEKRTRLAKKKFMKFYEQCIIGLLKQSQQNWEEDKLITITDEDGKETDITVNKTDLTDIDFDKDIEIDGESGSVNKDLMREQYISLYDKTKDDPIIDRKPLFKDMVRYGFNVNNPNRYIKKSELQPGQVLIDPNTQQQFTVDESGEVVPQQAINEMATPSGEQTIGSNQGLMNSM